MRIRVFRSDRRSVQQTQDAGYPRKAPKGDDIAAYGRSQHPAAPGVEPEVAPGEVSAPPGCFYPQR